MKLKQEKTLFNKHIVCTADSYEDDLANSFTGRYTVCRVQQCLDLLSEECSQISLNIAAAKFKAMALRLDVWDI